MSAEEEKGKMTLKPEYVKRFYPEVRILASGWTLDKLERYFSECEIFLAGKKFLSIAI